GDRSPWGDFWFTPISRLTGSGVRVDPGAAMGLPAVFACVQVLSKSFAMLPPCLYRPRWGGGRQRGTNHWLYRLLAQRAHRFQAPYEWRQMLQGHLVLRGNAFCQIGDNAQGEITDLLPLHPDRMKVEPLDNGEYRYVYTDANGRKFTYRRDEIWHLRGLSSD